MGCYDQTESFLWKNYDEIIEAIEYIYQNDWKIDNSSVYTAYKIW